MAELQVSKQSVKDLLGGMQGKKFLIPDYQRPYQWDTEKCETLWNDILEFSESKEQEYFLGTIVYFKNEDNKFEVIDGQQRLTTLLLLLRAIYKKLEGMKEDYNVRGLKSQIERCIWDVSPISEKVLKKEDFHIESLVALDEEKDNLAKILEKGEADEKAKDNYSLNFNHFFKIYDKFIRNHANEWEEICVDILKKCIILPVECNNQDTALTIFSHLNDRGLPLSDADIFKGKIYIYRKNKRTEKEFTEEWKKLSKISENLDTKKTDGLDDIFRFYYHYSRAKEGVSSSEIAVRKYFNDKKQYLENEYVMRDLLSLANFWAYLFDESKGCDSIPKITKETRKYLECLLKYPNEYWKYVVSVFFIEFFVKNDKNQNENFDENFQKLLKSTVRKFFVSYMIKPSVNSVKRCTYNAYCEIAKNNFQPTCLNLSEDEIKDAWNNVYNSGKLVSALVCLHANLNPNQKEPIGDFNVEHILPKKWQTANYNGVTEGDAACYLYKLGNQVALDGKANIKAGNKYFGQKKAIYKESSIADVRDLSEYKSELNISADDWGIEDIKKREEEFKKRLNKFFMEKN